VEAGDLDDGDTAAYTLPQLPRGAQARLDSKSVFRWRTWKRTRRPQCYEAFLARFKNDDVECVSVRAERTVYDFVARRRLRPRIPSVPRTKRPAPNWIKELGSGTDVGLL
jgi:hypothetical protein